MAGRFSSARRLWPPRRRHHYTAKGTRRHGREPAHSPRPSSAGSRVTAEGPQRGPPMRSCQGPASWLSRRRCCGRPSCRGRSRCWGRFRWRCPCPSCTCLFAVAGGPGERGRGGGAGERERRDDRGDLLGGDHGGVLPSVVVCVVITRQVRSRESVAGPACAAEDRPRWCCWPRWSRRTSSGRRR